MLDDTPILTAQQLKLAAWMRERLYCTFFDCVHVMLPAGLWFKRNETYTLASDADLAALRQRDGDAGRVLSLFDQPGQTLAVSDIRQRLGGKSVTRVLDTLTGEGVLIYHSNTVQESGRQDREKCSHSTWKRARQWRASAAAAPRGWMWSRCWRMAAG